MKNKATLMALMALAMMDSPNRGARYEPDNKQIKPIIPKGLKEFEIDGHKVFALNHKNALRKVKKLQFN